MPFADPERKRAYERSRVPRRRAWRRQYNRNWRARKRRERAIPQSRALDALRAQLKGTRGAERERIEGAIIHLERVLSGERVKPRDPRRTELRPVHPIPFNRRPAAAADDDGGPARPTGRYVPSWMDEKLPPESR